MVKDDRVGLYIMPLTRNKLNLVKAQISLQVGRPLNQDETIEHLIQMFERINGHTSYTYVQEQAHAQS